MSLPAFSTQAELFSTAGLSSSLFAQSDRYRLFAQQVYPAVAGAREELAKCYCADNGRVAIEPVLMLGVSILQELEAIIPAPERPLFWLGLWERYVESQIDSRASAETLGRKLGEAGADAWQ